MSRPDVRSVTIVGASLAGVASARALRDHGFEGRITMLGDEAHQPYDRPSLSKGFLLGDAPVPLDIADLDVDWRLGTAATGLSATTVATDSGEIVGDAVVLATGASAIRLPGTCGTGGIHVLRTLDDARRLRSELLPGRRVTVVGIGFIGSEVASTALMAGATVTVVEASDIPLARVFGSHLGPLIAGRHERAGARLLTGRPVTSFVTEGTDVRAVELADGTLIESDVVVLGIGSTPNIGWLTGSGLELADGVVTDERGVTSHPAVVAVGDCAAVRDSVTGAIRREEHWTAAATRPAVAVEALLTGSPTRFTGLPYVWSDQHGARIQFAGHRTEDCTTDIVEGDPSGAFVALYRRGEDPVAVLAVSSPRSFGRWRRQLVDLSSLPA